MVQKKGNLLMNTTKATPYRVLSWGCGLQSTTLGEMSARGDLPRLDLIITADTKWEREVTYKTRAFYSDRWRKMGMRVEIVTIGNVREQGAEGHIHIPFFTDGGGPMRRQCTPHFKDISDAQAHPRDTWVSPQQGPGPSTWKRRAMAGNHR